MRTQHMGPTALGPIQKMKQWLNVLVKVTSVMTGGFEPTLCWSETPEFEFFALNHLAKTLLQKTYLIIQWN